MTKEEAVNVLRIMASGIELKGYSDRWILNFREAYEMAFKSLENERPQGEIIKELWNCRNELCLKCEKYHDAWKGACNDCRYNFENMEKWKGEQE